MRVPSKFSMAACVITLGLVQAVACTSDPDRPPVLLEGSSKDSPCSRIHGTCTPQFTGGCAAGTVSAGSTFRGCPGETDICCIANDAGVIPDATPAGDAASDAASDAAPVVEDASTDAADATPADTGAPADASLAD